MIEYKYYNKTDCELKMSEPPVKKMCFNPSPSGVSTDDDSESDVGIEFSVHSHSSSGDRCSSSLGSDGRASFSSDGFEPLSEPLQIFVDHGSSQDQQKSTYNGDSSIFGYKSEDNEADNTTQEYEMILPNYGSVSSEGFSSNERGGDDSEIDQRGDDNTPEQSTSIVANGSDEACLHHEAEVIADVLSVSYVDTIYRRLEQLKTKANRSDIVTNELLEGGIDSLRKWLDNVDPEGGGTRIRNDMNQSEHDRSSCEEYKPNHVTSCLLENNDNSCSQPKSGTSSKTHDDGLFHDVQLIQKDMPTADPNVIVSLLEKFYDDKDRVLKVMNTLKSSDKHDVVDTDISDLQSEFAGMPLYNDLKKVASLFPNQDKNEIYAYLEAHYHNPNRIQVVIDELLQLEQGCEEMDESPSKGETKLSNTKRSKSCQNESSFISDLQKDVDTLHQIFPDCDPDYLFTELESLAEDSMRTIKLASRLFESRDYPLLKDRLKKEQTMKQLAKLRQHNLNINEFLQMFPDPVKTFYSEDKQVGDSYIKHAKQQLLNEFPMIKSGYIEKKLNSHNNHYLPTKKELNQMADIYRKDPVAAVKNHKCFLVDHRGYYDSMPSEPDELFYRELLFSRNEQQILEHIKKMKDEKRQRVEEAREKSELLECPCCYDDECLLEDMASCPDGHLFCKQCVRKFAETNMAQSKLNFICLDAYCELEFSLNTLQCVLSPNTFSVLLHKIQEDEVNRANIKDLVSCPFCSFASIMCDPNDKVFKCLNPECLKESCRFCQEPNHIPLRCDEVEKESEKNMRAYIEKRMSEAMIRQCWRCKKRFFKVEGCNKMTCVCGASMCYVCRKPITDYEHFSDGRCSNKNANALHLTEMKEAARRAREEYESEHPEASNYKLKYDPIRHLPGTHDGV